MKIWYVLKPWLSLVCTTNVWEKNIYKYNNIIIIENNLY